MSSPPFPSAPLADRLAWLAGEVRSEKEDAGMIVAVFMEVFARLLTRLAGFAARVEAGTVKRPEPHATPSRRIIAPAVAPGLLPRALDWLGGVLPLGGPMALPHDTALPRTERPRAPGAVPRVAVQPRAERPADGWEDFGPSEADADAAPPTAATSDARWEWVRIPPFALPASASAWAEVPLAVWRPLPASTAGPFVRIGHFDDRLGTCISLRYQN